MLLSRERAGLIVCAAWLCACGSVRGPARIVSPATADSVRVKVEAPRGVELWRVGEGGDSRVCSAPCESVIEGAAELEARVVDLPDSPRFQVPPSASGIIVEVLPGAKVMPGLAAVTSTVGAAAMLVGGAFALADVAGNRDLEGAALPGAITAVVGGGILAAGLVFVHLSGTHVKLREALATPGRVQF